MTIVMGTPQAAELDEVVGVLRQWQGNGTPLQLHPGDIGWNGARGPEATAAALRVWRRDGEIVAIGMLDEPTLIRIAKDPAAHQDDELARRLVADVTTPEQGALPAGDVGVELPLGALAHDLLGEAGWGTDDPWIMLRRDLTEPVEDPGVRVETAGPELLEDWTAVHRAVWAPSKFHAEHFGALEQSPAFADARPLLAYDEQGNPVANVIVWSAGQGRYGLLEPMGAHPDHRGHGYGRAIVVAAAAALREMGASAAIVITPGTYTGAVATYTSAGFENLGERRDRIRRG